jgi:hypothetical protein
MLLLHLWVAKNGRVVTVDLERALKAVGRNDIVDRYIYGIGIDSPETSVANGLYVNCV